MLCSNSDWVIGIYFNINDYKNINIKIATHLLDHIFLYEHQTITSFCFKKCICLPHTYFNNASNHLKEK